MPRFNIHHVTKYTYEAPVRDSANQIILFPVKDEYQDVVKQEIHISGEPGIGDLSRIIMDNEIGSFMNAEPHFELLIDSKVQVMTKPRDRCRRTIEPKRKAMGHTFKRSASKCHLLIS